MKNEPRKIFTVIINKKEFDVYDIEGKEHEGHNDTPKTWWVYYSDRLPITPPADSDHFIPMHSGIERLLWEIKFVQHTTTKVKWDELRFRSHTSCEMWCNGRLIYSFGTTGGSRGMSFAMAKAQYMQTALGEHPYNFFESETEKGRKICWYGLPATIQPRSVDGWEICIYPDYTAGLTKEEWWSELKRREHKFTAPDQQFDEMEAEDFKENQESDYINWGDAFSDQHIYWFRK